MERRRRGGEGCGKARGMYSLGNWKEGGRVAREGGAAGGRECGRGCGNGRKGDEGEVRGGAGEYEGKRGDVGKR